MLDIGTIIKNKRLESSLTHEEISAALRIKIRLLIALEEIIYKLLDLNHII